MECVICKNGNAFNGFTTVTLEQNNSVVIIKEVPALICNNCGHFYLSEELATKVLAIAQETVRKGIEIEVSRFSVAS
ncbi:MAG: type II toxin-antitoxin system MqsA family antitoxin [Bacteroidota bacterium]